MGATCERLRLLVSASAALMAAAGEAPAQTSAPPPPPSAAANENEDEEEIVILAPEDETRIDRRTYTVRNDPAAQASNGLDILGRIPSVSVAPSGAIRLLGADGVVIQINGQPVPGASLDQVLRTLTGNEIERIEVISNPAATQSASGAGGIINIITRDRFNAGFNGSLIGAYDSLDSRFLSVAPAWTGGPWTLSGRLGYVRNYSDGWFRRRREDLNTSIITSEAGASDQDVEQRNGNVQLGYRFNERQRMSLNVEAFAVDGVFDQRVARENDLGPIDTQTTLGTNVFTYQRAFLFYQQTGEEQSVLKLNGVLEHNENTSLNIVTTAPAGGGPDSQFATPNGQDTTNASLKLDFERPFEHRRMLQTGAAYDFTDQEISNALETLAGPPGPPDYNSVINGSQHTAAAYATFQFATGDWTWQPGLRAENYWRTVESGGIENEYDDLRVFPSLHIRRRMPFNLDLDLSYSSRIRRPDFYQLDPTVRFFEPTRASSGNPDLDPTTTDAYEANLTYQSGTSTFGVTFFDRISQDIVSQVTEVTGGGVILSHPVNAGESEQRGLQTILRAPLGNGWRYSLSANFLNREFDVLRNGATERRNEFEYSGNAQIEWREANQNQPRADFFQFEVQFQGPRYSLQGDSDEFFVGNFTWRRRITDRVIGTLFWQDVFDTNEGHSTTRTDDIFERVDSQNWPPRVRLQLTYQFGATDRAPPPQDQPPPSSNAAPP